MEFKVGDRVKVIEKSGRQTPVGAVGTVADIGKYDEYYIRLDKFTEHDCWRRDGGTTGGAGKIPQGYCDFIKEGKLELLTKSPSGAMKKLTTYLKRQLNPETRKFYRAGMINGELEPTEEGKKDLEAIVWFEHLKQLAVRADERIAEAKKEEK